MASSLSAAFTAIANAIRAKKGVSTTYTPDEMPDAIASIQTNPNLQNKTTTVTPGANWSGTNTNNSTITADSGYDGLSQVNVNVPMLRDGTLMTADSVSTPGTVYNGNTSQSNSSQLLRMHPTKDGMSYTGSYLYLQGSSYLGNATASDVVSGKTFSSSSGIQVTGTGSSGTDTSDATLTSGSQMLSGYTAYARGTKYTGSITSRSASSETISSAKTYSAGYYPSSWTVTPSGGTTPSGTKYDTYYGGGDFSADVTNYATHYVTIRSLRQDQFTPSTSSTTYVNIGYRPQAVFVYYGTTSELSDPSAKCAWSFLTNATWKMKFFASVSGSTKNAYRTTDTDKINCISSLDATGFTMNKVSSTYAGTWEYIVFL